jgi:hypothetical protein
MLRFEAPLPAGWRGFGFRVSALAAPRTKRSHTIDAGRHPMLRFEAPLPAGWRGFGFRVSALAAPHKKQTGGSKGIPPIRLECLEEEDQLLLGLLLFLGGLLLGFFCH